MPHTRTSSLSRTQTTFEILPPRFARTLSSPSSSRKLRLLRLLSPTPYVSASCRNVTASSPPRRIRKRRSGRRRKRRSSGDESERIAVVHFHLARTTISLTVTAIITTTTPRAAMTDARVLAPPPVPALLTTEVEIAPTTTTVLRVEIAVLSHGLTAGTEALIIAIGGLPVTRTAGKVVLHGLALTNPPPGVHLSATPATGAENAPVEVAGMMMSPANETAVSVPWVMTASMASVPASALPLRAPCLLPPRNPSHPPRIHPTPPIIVPPAWLLWLRTHRA